MQERLSNIWGNLLERWNGLDRTQKIRLSLTAIIVVLVLAATVYFITKPNMVELAGNLSYADASQIKKALTDEGIRNSTGAGGTSILVRDKDVDTAQMLLADKNIPKTQGFTWADALSASGMSATETIKKENVRLAQETAIAQKLMVFEGVESATVYLSLPDDNSFFLDSKKAPSVSVTLTTSAPFTQAQSQAVARQLCRAVVGLTMDNIEIVNQNMETLYSGLETQAGSTGYDYSIELERKKEIESKVKAALLPLYPDVRVVSNIVLNMDKTSSVTQTITSPTGEGNSTGVVLEEDNYKESATGTSAGAQPGLGSNDNTGITYQTTDGSQTSAASQQSSAKYGYNSQETVYDGAIGTLIPEKSAVSVFVYKYKTYDQEYMTKNDLLGGQRWEDFKVENGSAVVIPVDQSIIDDLKIGTGISNLTVSGFEIPQFEDQVARPIQINQIIMFGILVLLIGLLAIALIRRAKAESAEDIEPELSVEDLIVSDQLEKEREEEMRLKDIEYLKESETKMQIEKFIQEKPEAVASLLRNWLNEDWE